MEFNEDRLPESALFDNDAQLEMNHEFAVK